MSAWLSTSVVAASDPAVRAVYEACVSATWPTSDDAEDRNRACSKALQTRMLDPREIARARVTRGIARVALGDKVLATDDYVEALKHYDSIIDSKNPDALDLALRAASLDGLGQTERALEAYAEAIKRDPQGGLAYLGRGVLLARRKRAYERAIEDFDKVIALNGRNVEALIARGSALGELGHTGRALADLDRAITLSPGRAQPYVERGKIYDRIGKSDAALKDFDTALQLNLRDTSAFINRAAVHAKQGNHASAIRDLDAALSLGGGTPVLFYNRGYSHFAKREYAQAIADYSVAIALDPKMGRAYNNRCLTRAVLGQDLVRAMNDCDMAQKLVPLSLDVRATRGFVYLKLGDPRLALHEYDAVLALDPNRPIALYGRGLARIAIGKVQEGEADKAAALALLPEVADAFTPFGLK